MPPEPDLASLDRLFDAAGPGPAGRAVTLDERARDNALRHAALWLVESRCEPPEPVAELLVDADAVRLREAIVLLARERPMPEIVHAILVGSGPPGRRRRVPRRPSSIPDQL